VSRVLINEINFIPAMTRLSVNINKIATLRNARGGNNPDVIRAAMDCERFGAQGITVHPRPDERHIRYMKIIRETRPHQATLVPDKPDAITSNAGWETITHKKFLADIISEIKSLGVRVSVFVDPVVAMVEGAREVGADRIELYTEPYAAHYHENKTSAIQPYVEAAKVAHQLGLGINAGHDLDLKNLRYLNQSIPHLDEVSIGHALICDALYLGLENTIQLYLRELR
jgi:pyridoxine 5-phosphate synthase